MIGILKNKEVRRALLLQVLLSVPAVIAVFAIDTRAGLIVFLLAAVLIGVFLIATYRRYRRIAALAYDINSLLHGDNTISMESYSEGELSILHSEVYKMTVRLREQQQRLLNDKVYLADSIADISHQIRTPLTAINLMVELLADPHTKEERRPQLIHELQTMLSRIDWLITTLLKLSKLDAGTVQFKQEQLPMAELIGKACAPLLVPIELRRQELSVTAEGTFTGDIAWTCEAVGNILKNCMEHTPEGGKLEIEGTENTLFTEIVIRDTGSGISKADLPHIFERFYKGEGSDGKSFGIGLALSRMIVTGQKGTIKAENRQPKGARFTIRFYKGTV